MKMLASLCLSVCCLHAMDWPIHSDDGGKPLALYWGEILNIKGDEIKLPEARSLYTYLLNLVKENNEMLLLTPQKLACSKLAIVYEVLHGKKLDMSALSRREIMQLIEETARSIEGIFAYLIAMQKQAEAKTT